MAQEFNKLEWYDEEVWTLLAKTFLHKTKPQNVKFFHIINSSLRELNANPRAPLYKKLDKEIDELKKFYRPDFQWRYLFEEARFKTY